jgi:F-type H+-transporting ATPase subunit a
MQEISLKAEELFRIGSFPVTNSLVISFIVLIFFIILGFVLKKKIALVPGKLQAFFEIFLEGALDLMDSILGDRKKSERFLPLVMTIFLTVVISNWFGLLPGVGSLGINLGQDHETIFVPFFRSPSADLNFTLSLAIISVFMVNTLGMVTVGFLKYLGRFINLKNPIYTFVGFLEFISEFAKMISFSFRLFGNIFAGEVLLIIVSFLIPFLIPVPFLFLEFFVGFMQAFVFAMLTLVFLSIATTVQEH